MVGLWKSRLVLLVNQSSYFLSHRLNVAQAAIEAGMDVHLITQPSGDLRPIERRGVTVHPIEFPRNLHSPAVEWRAVRRLSGLYRRLQPDLVHHFSAKAVVLGSLAARHERLDSVVNTFTGLGAVFSGTGLRAGCKRIVARQALRYALRPAGWQVTFQNVDDMHELIDRRIVTADRCRVIRGSGVDPERFRPLGNPVGSGDVLLASRMIWTKGIGEFVEAARQLRRRATACRCLLVGDNDPENSQCVPRAQLQRWQAEGVVQWLGHCHDMADQFARASIVVLPTYGEGLPKALLEAAATARPIVATDVPGCREIVQPMQNGLLVPPRNATALADAIEYLIDRPVQRVQMGREGRKLVLQHFTAEHVAQQTLAIYREMLRCRPVLSIGPRRKGEERTKREGPRMAKRTHG